MRNAKETVQILILFSLRLFDTYQTIIRRLAYYPRAGALLAVIGAYGENYTGTVKQHCEGIVAIEHTKIHQRKGTYRNLQDKHNRNPQRF